MPPVVVVVGIEALARIEIDRERVDHALRLRERVRGAERQAAAEAMVRGHLQRVVVGDPFPGPLGHGRELRDGPQEGIGQRGAGRTGRIDVLRIEARALGHQVLIPRGHEAPLAIGDVRRGDDGIEPDVLLNFDRKVVGHAGTAAGLCPSGDRRRREHRWHTGEIRERSIEQRRLEPDRHRRRERAGKIAGRVEELLGDAIAAADRRLAAAGRIPRKPQPRLRAKPGIGLKGAVFGARVVIEHQAVVEVAAVRHELSDQRDGIRQHDSGDRILRQARRGGARGGRRGAHAGTYRTGLRAGS